MASLISRPSKTGPVYYVQYWQGPKQKRFRASDSFQIAKQKLRDFENAQARGDDSPLPTATPITPEDVDWKAGKHGMLRIRAKTVGEESWRPRPRSYNQTCG